LLVNQTLDLLSEFGAELIVLRAEHGVGRVPYVGWVTRHRTGH
jgi:hypothetical protein